MNGGRQHGVMHSIKNVSREVAKWYRAEVGRGVGNRTVGEVAECAINERKSCDVAHEVEHACK